MNKNQEISSTENNTTLSEQETLSINEFEFLIEEVSFTIALKNSEGVPKIEIEKFENELGKLSKEKITLDHHFEIAIVEEMTNKKRDNIDNITKEEIVQELETEPITQEQIKHEKIKPKNEAKEKILRKIRKGLLYLGITAGVGSAVAPIKIKDGEFGYNLNNAIENTTSVLSDDLQQTALRGLAKYGYYNPIKYEEVVDITKIKEARQKEITMQEMLKKEYQSENTFFEVVGKVRDSHYKARKGVRDSLLMVRNQFFNENGFVYVAGTIKDKMQEGQKYKNVEGVAHFMILDDYGCDVSENTPDEYIEKCSARFKKERIGYDIDLSDYVPVFTKLDDGKVRVQYKIASELVESDITITRLHQYKFSNINWDGKINAEKFGFSKESGIYGITSFDGTPLPNFLYTEAGKNAYSRFSGASVVFIFKDSNGNAIVRDFTGSLSMVQKEGVAIMKTYGVNSKELTMGVYDAGSYTAKPSAVNGVLDTKQYTGYNTLHPNSAGSLIYPKQK